MEPFLETGGWAINWPSITPNEVAKSLVYSELGAPSRGWFALIIRLIDELVARLPKYVAASMILMIQLQFIEHFHHLVMANRLLSHRDPWA